MNANDFTPYQEVMISQQDDKFNEKIQSLSPEFLKKSGLKEVLELRNIRSDKGQNSTVAWDDIGATEQGLVMIAHFHPLMSVTAYLPEELTPLQ